MPLGRTHAIAILSSDMKPRLCSPLSIRPTQLGCSASACANGTSNFDDTLDPVGRDHHAPTHPVLIGIRHVADEELGA